LLAKDYAPHLGYSLAKLGMSYCTLGWASELRPFGIAANSLWPKTIIDTSAVRNLLGGESVARKGRRPEIVADAAHAILCRDSRTFSGNFIIDEQILREIGVTDFDHYQQTPGEELLPDLFLPQEFS
jgi:citronellol/citronellal dehydrogenase